MEFIKKIIKQAVTTGTTENSNKNTFIIIPDLTVDYHMKVLLTSKSLDLGFFDTDLKIPDDTSSFINVQPYSPVNNYYYISHDDGLDSNDDFWGAGEYLLLDDEYI